MAIFITGMTCKLCGQPMKSDDDIISFPPFVSNSKDVLYLFNDGSFHKVCFESHPLSNKAIERLKLHFENNSASRRICRITNEHIDDPDDFFSLGYLTSDDESELAKWNYAHFKKSAIKNWDKLDIIIDLLEHHQARSEWEHSDLQWIIDELKSLGKNGSQ